MRKINCWYDDDAKTWMATFDDPQLLAPHQKGYVLAWKKPMDQKKVLVNMAKSWKTHSVTLRRPEAERQRHPALRG